SAGQADGGGASGLPRRLHARPRQDRPRRLGALPVSGRGELDRRHQAGAGARKRIHAGRVAGPRPPIGRGEHARGPGGSRDAAERTERRTGGADQAWRLRRRGRGVAAAIPVGDDREQGAGGQPERGTVRSNSVDFDIPQDVQTLLKELDDFIEAEIKPLEQQNDNIRFFDHRREYERTDFENGGVPRKEWDDLLAEMRRRADRAGFLRYGIPSKYGGRDGPNLAMAIIREHLRR